MPSCKLGDSSNMGIPDVHHAVKGKDGRIRGAWDLAHDNGQLQAKGRDSLRHHLIEAGTVQTSASVTAYTGLGPCQWRKPGAPKRGKDLAWTGYRAEGTPERPGDEGHRLSPGEERALRHEASARKWGE